MTDDIKDDRTTTIVSGAPGSSDPEPAAEIAPADGSAEEFLPSRKATRARRSAAQKQRLIFHIGVHRTGTTAMQHVFSQNRDRLASLGLIYPLDIAPPPRGAINQKTLNHANLVWALDRKALMPSDMVAWLKGVAHNRNDTLLISAEDFARTVDVSFLAPLLDDFAVEVVVYLRRQDEWVNSWYNQIIRNAYEQKKSRATPMEFLLYLDTFYWLKYFNLLERWAAVVGRENIRVRIFEKSQVTDTVSDMFQICCGRALPVDLKSLQSNGSIPADQLELIRRLNLRQFPPNTRTAIYKAITSTPSVVTSNVYPASIRQLIFKRYWHQNRQVAEIYLKKPDQPLFSDQAFPEDSFTADSSTPLDQKLMHDFMARYLGREGARPPGRLQNP